MAITKVINDAVDLTQAGYSGLRLPVGTTADITDTFTADYLIVAGGGGGGTGITASTIGTGGGGGAGGLRTSFNNSTTTTNNLNFPSGKTAIATYMLNGDATDVSGNYNGTEVNPTYNAGLYGGAAIFNGSNAYIDLPLSTSSLFDGKNTLAVSFWFKTTTAARQRMFTDYAQTSRNCDIVIDSGNIEVTTDYNQSTNLTYTSSSTYNDGNWHNIIVSLDQSAGQRTIYIDGSLVDTGTLSTNSWSGSGQKVTLGAFYSSSSGYSGYFDGSIDQLRIYNSALDSTNASNIYNNEAQADSGGGSAAESSLTLTAGTSYTVTIGDGGVGGYAGGANPTNGNDSVFSTITSTGGGAGGNYRNPTSSTYYAQVGGSGGGAAYTGGFSAGAAGTIGQGYQGGDDLGNSGAPAYGHGGGGGAAARGVNGGGTGSGAGGSGLALSITGTSTTYGGGGGGGGINPYPAGAGGSGGGGAGGYGNGNPGYTGAANTGGGGGGAGKTSASGTLPGDGAAGGSGIVILRYPTASVASFTTTGTLNTPSTTDTVANNNYPTTNSAYYKLDGDATDSSGNGNNGTASNITWQNGRFNEAALFNGSSSKIELPNSNLGITDASNFSISYWFNTFSATQSNQSAIWTNGSNAGARFGSGINSSSQGGNTSVYFGVGTSAFTYINSGTSAFAANTWVHVVCIKSSTTGISLYVDNVLKATNTGATGAASTTASGKNALGMYNTASDSLFFNGFIDQVRLFNTAISESQVADLYNEHYQTKFIDGADTALLFTRGTGSITFSGSDPIPPQGAVRTNTSFSEDGSASAIEHYNGTEWKQFDAIKYCTTNTLNFPAGAGCIASYNFNDNVNDIGNTYNGTNSGVTFTSSGKFGAAAIFNSDYITTPSVIPTNNFSFSFWVNMASFPGSATNQVVFVQNESNNRWYISVYESGKIQAWNGATSFTTSSSVINLNQWHHVVYTASSSTGKKIYVDGTEVLSDADTNNNTGTATGNLFIGFGKWYANSLYLDAKLDQTRIFNTALTPTQISSLYNNEIACS